MHAQPPAPQSAQHAPKRANLASPLAAWRPLSKRREFANACRCMIPKVQEALEQAPTSTRACATFFTLLSDFEFVLREHMRHEDDVIFPAADGWMPHHSDPFAQVRCSRTARSPFLRCAACGPSWCLRCESDTVAQVCCGRPRISAATPPPSLRYAAGGLEFLLPLGSLCSDALRTPRRRRCQWSLIARRMPPVSCARTPW